ncbi:MAG: sodium:solute symporter [Hyphomicrobiaceae bacterium]
MPDRQSATLVNPMVGIYFGIFAASLAAIVVLLLIFEKLGFAERSLKTTMALGAMTLFASVGIGAYTNRFREYANAGRRIPAFYNGLTLTVTILGGAGLTGLSGALFLAGFDMLFMGLGLLAGLTAMLMLVAPFVRKFGVPTIPGYLGKRFESTPVRLASASLAVIPLFIFLIAEFKIALLALSWLVPMAPAFAAALLAFVLVATLAPGGVRSLSWSSAAQALAVLVAVLLPTAIAAVLQTNLPFGQFSHGPTLRAVARDEATLGLQIPIATLLTFEVPGQGLQAFAGRYTSAFGNVGPLAFVLGILSIMAGVAGSPALLARAVTMPTVYDTRKSIGWAVILVGLMLTTFSAVAVFERHVLAEDLLRQSSGGAAPGIAALVEHGFATIATGEARLKPGSVMIERDATLVALPALFALPRVVVSLVAAGILAAALAGAAASLTQLALILGEDVIHAPQSWLYSDNQRLTVCRIAMAILAAAGATAAISVPGDPLMLYLNALAFSGATLFPVLLLSVWWKRLNALGTLAALASSFVVILIAIGTTELSGLSLPLALAPALAAPIAIVVGMIVSQLTPPPGRHILESVRDLRVPGGETVYDRELRRARQRSSTNT